MRILHRRTRHSLASERVTAFDGRRLKQLESSLSSLDILLSYAVKPGLVAISFRHRFPPRWAGATEPRSERRRAVPTMFALLANQTSFRNCDDYATLVWQELTRGRVDTELWGAFKLIFSIAKAQGGRKRCVFVVKVTASIYLLVRRQSENYLLRVSRLFHWRKFPKRSKKLNCAGEDWDGYLSSKSGEKRAIQFATALCRLSDMV